jgi:hypothetical protein
MQRIVLQAYLKRINWAKGDDRRDKKNPMAAFHYSMVHDCPGSRQPGWKGAAAFGFPAHAD